MLYIKDSICISAQHTYDLSFFNGNIVAHTGVKFHAIEPSYSDLIPGGILRRMSKVLRMGVGTGMPLLKKYADIQAIIIATAYGGIDDSMKFLMQIEEYCEGTLTPTHFVQSTPNSLSGTLSMMSGCNGYNNTHVHQWLAFENALLDAILFKTSKNGDVLVGAADEISDWNFIIETQKGYYKVEDIRSETLLKSSTSGTVCGEGAITFLLSSEPANALARLADVNLLVSDCEADIDLFFQELFERNNLLSSDIECIISGMNGNIHNDKHYECSINKYFSESGHYVYKHLTGDFPTSAAFAMWFAMHYLQGRTVPEIMIRQMSKKQTGKVLIYNQYENKYHGLILITRHE